MSTKHRVLRPALVMAPLSVLVVLALVAAVALGGDLSVEDYAAFPPTSFGLEVTPNACAGQVDLVLSSGTVSTDQAGCETITASNVTVESPGSTFTAGQSIALGDGFSVASGASFVAVIDSTVSQFAYVGDNTPANETTYQAEFGINLNDLTLGSGDQILVFVAYSSNDQEALRAWLDENGAITVEARLDSGTWQSSSAFALPAGWATLAFDFRAGSGNGHLRFGIDTAAAAVGLESLSNSTRTIGSVSLGAVDALGGVIGSASGSYFLDEFSSFR